MSDTITTVDAEVDAQHDVDTLPGQAARQPAGRECFEVDPATLVVGDNVRATARLDRAFLASLRAYGVMDPIHVTRADDGTLTVQRGQRRTLGAVKVGLNVVPVLIVDQHSDEADRITRQWHENERRDALSESDRLAAVEQLTMLGVPAGSIAKRLGTPKKDVEAAVATNGSQRAKDAVRKHALTFTDAALIAEFEDDPDTVKDLLRAIEYGESAEHVAQRARDEKARQQAHEQAVAALVEAGVTVIERPSYSDKTIKELRDIRMLKRDGEPKAKAPTEAEHATCPGHAAYVTVYSASNPHVTYVCTDPKANGHGLYSWNGQTRLPSQQTGGTMTEQQKAERRTLIANNKAWDSAEKVRRAWLTESFLTRTTPPRGAEVFLAVAIANGEHSEDYHRLYTTMTGTTQDTDYWNASSAIADRAAAATPRQALMLAVALLVCEWESTTSRTTWRNPTQRNRRYMSALIDWGYKPSDVERLILADTTNHDETDSVDSPHDADAARPEDDEQAQTHDDSEEEIVYDAEVIEDPHDDDGVDAQPVSSPSSAGSPYQKHDEWWYRFTSPTTGETRPRGPFTSRQEALTDADDLAALAQDTTETTEGR